ncbi:electron transport complex protein RnfG [Ectothiorhodosinus mongolicus]|uniref:Ion-translocating oxidoreductase complex subunit G n=1 Tax=Ectothiorhodosinus mongolicus TaxID=233100 RepID=A0A1R3VZD5_9GAMM|nr:electron transport complex subunit RsxG [Ectothiorhodosinus mongolicus]ULX57203.1 electron transport complex subunit RsxG [Ectothiorhodosinus mongolicus]SIT70403.1 electron transport complex protein RnfG [Ectothiorhodosinus mongolicus]
MGRNIIISTALLALFGLLGTTLVALIHDSTRERIAANIEAATLARLNEILPEDLYDNDILQDSLRLSDPLLGGDDLEVYLARRQSEPVAVVFTVVARGGYSGDIHMLVGVFMDGRIAGTRVVAHRETPGLGDDIEATRSDWILGFNERSLADPEEDLWAVHRDGGVFDQFTGATVTPRAVVRAVRNALLYFQAYGSDLFQMTAETGNRAD